MALVWTRPIEKGPGGPMGESKQHAERCLEGSGGQKRCRRRDVVFARRAGKSLEIEIQTSGLHHNRG